MRYAALLILHVCFLFAGYGQNFSGGFNFFLPPDDTATTRFLPRFSRSPLTSQDFIGIDPDGHFSVRGTPVRFFGANIVTDAAFPQGSLTWSIAGRLRKMGFNLVRFHHIDNPWSGGSLFEQGWTTRQLNPVTLDRLERLLAELKQNGIYADINLHVSRTFTAMDGLPDTDSLQEFGKAINYFDPAVLALHKEYALQLLTHVNPYTGLSLANDPVMAMVELTNENSLYRYWRDGKLKHFSEGGMLTARHVRMLDSLWHAYLAGRYGSTAALQQAWSEGAHPSDGLNRIVNGSFELVPPSTGWVMEIHSPATGFHRWDSTSSNTGKYSARVDVSNADGTDWHVQWKQIGLSVTKDTTYVIEFAARADSTRTISIALMRDVSPWNWYGGISVRLTTEWKVFSFNVRAPESLTNAVRLSFTTGGQAGTYWFDDISLTTVAVDGLLTDESLEAPHVRRIDYADCAGYSPVRVSDMSHFYLNLEEEYYSSLRRYLTDTLHVRCPVVGTNWNIGPADIFVQSNQDYIDNHSYWDHPSFPGIPWSSTDWNISNTAMVRNQSGGTIAALFAGAPVVGKPFTISEYNHAFPNRFQSEAMLFLAAYGAFHDADGLMLFDYNSSNVWEADRIANYFSIHRNPAMMALAPSCAAAFRAGMISPALQTLVLNYAPADILTLPRRDASGWLGATLIDRTLALQYGVRTGSFASQTPFDPATLPGAPSPPFVTDTEEIRWDVNGLLAVTSQRFVGLTGFLSEFQGHQAGPLTLQGASGFGTLTWVAPDADSIRVARQSLLTVSSMAQNTGMVWDGTTTIHNNWGQGPTQVAPLSLSLELHMNADSLHVFPLDSTGRETKGHATLIPQAANIFHLVVDQTQTRSMWFGIESFGDGAATSADATDGTVPLQSRLEQNYPNPFNPTTVVRYQLPLASEVRVVVYDLLGREVAVLVNERKPPAVYTVSFDGTRLSSGVYICRMTAGAYVESRKMVLTK